MADDLIIREAVEKDARGILEAHHASVREKASAYYSDNILEAWSSSDISPDRINKMSAQIREGEFYTLVACYGESILGFGQVSPQKNLLGAVYVRKSAHKRVGSRLLEGLFQHARQKGARYLEMDASLNAQAFYAKAGFRVVSREAHILSSGLEMSCVKMRIDL